MNYAMLAMRPRYFSSPAQPTQPLVASDGSLFAWGRNFSLQLGGNYESDTAFGNLEFRESPLQVNNNTWSSVSSGNLHTVAIAKDGTLWGWGGNYESQVGVPGAGDGPLPPTSIDSGQWLSVSAGEASSFAIKNDGTLWSWGDADYGVLGNGVSGGAANAQSAPTQLGSSQWNSVSSGDRSVHAIRNDGTLWGWGGNAWGEIGDGTKTQRNTPVQVGAGTWAAVSNGGSVTAGVSSDGSLYSWGYWGEIISGSVVEYLSPVELDAGQWTSVSCAGNAAVAIKGDGTLWAWGRNYWGVFGNGQSGNGSYSAIPVQVGSDTWKSAVTNGASVLAIKSNDTLWRWGRAVLNGVEMVQTNPEQIGSDRWSFVEAGFAFFAIRKVVA